MILAPACSAVFVIPGVILFSVSFSSREIKRTFSERKTNRQNVFFFNQKKNFLKTVSRTPAKLTRTSGPPWSSRQEEEPSNRPTPVQHCPPRFTMPSREQHDQDTLPYPTNATSTSAGSAVFIIPGVIPFSVSFSSREIKRAFSKRKTNRQNVFINQNKKQ